MTKILYNILFTIQKKGKHFAGGNQRSSNATSTARTPLKANIWQKHSAGSKSSCFAEKYPRVCRQMSVKESLKAETTCAMLYTCFHPVISRNLA